MSFSLGADALSYDARPVAVRLDCRCVTWQMSISKQGTRRVKIPRRAISAHQRHKPATAGDFEFAEDRVEVLFHHWHTQPGVFGDLLVTPPFADKSRDFLFAPRQSDKMRQTGARRLATRSRRAQIFALDKKMRPRYTSQLELLQANRCSQVRRSRMMHPFFFEAC
jgi:hypothetical protein